MLENLQKKKINKISDYVLGHFKPHSRIKYMSEWPIFGKYSSSCWICASSHTQTHHWRLLLEQNVVTFTPIKIEKCALLRIQWLHLQQQEWINFWHSVIAISMKDTNNPLFSLKFSTQFVPNHNVPGDIMNSSLLRFVCVYYFFFFLRKWWGHWGELQSSLFSKVIKLNLP